MKDTYGKRIYKCKCGAVNEEYAWGSELKAHVFDCTMCKVKLSYANLEAKKAIQSASIRTPTKNR